MKYKPWAVVVTGVCLLAIAVLCGLGISSVLNKQDADGPATTPSGHFTKWSGE